LFGGNRGKRGVGSVVFCVRASGGVGENVHTHTLSLTHSLSLIH
jgi:hypothetical protein